MNSEKICLLDFKYIPSESEIEAACFYMRHDFEIISNEDQEMIRWHANEWLHAWRKVNEDFNE